MFKGNEKLLRNTPEEKKWGTLREERAVHRNRGRSSASNMQAGRNRASPERKRTTVSLAAEEEPIRRGAERADHEGAVTQRGLPYQFHLGIGGKDQNGYSA